MHGDDVFDKHIALGGCGGDHERARLNLIRDDAVIASVQPLDATDADGVRPDAADARAHLV